MELIQEITSRDFLLNQAPASNLESLLPWIAGFGGLIILSIVSIIVFLKVNPIAAKIKGMINTWMVSLGLVGLFAVFFRSQQLSIFSKNIFLVIIFTVSFIWLICIIAYIVYKYPKEISKYRDRERIAKYLPKSKSKK